MKTYLVTLLVASMGCEKRISEVVRADSVESANRTAMLNECHTVTESDFDEVLARNNGEYLEDGGHGYRIESTIPLHQIDVNIDGKKVPLLIPEIINNFHIPDHLERLAEAGSLPYLVEITWIADGEGKTIQAIEWADSSNEAMANALVGAAGDYETEAEIQEKIQEIITSGIMEIEDSRGGFIASCAQVLTLIDFKTEGKMYSGLVDMSAT
ncbi:MAG: hypothetical protein J6N72_02395, partial [Psychrobacter sp.]|nr:hypothetical protein [Psychrobacter sp.]